MYHQTETLVIGGGAIGICCAYYLHGLGKNVTVVDRGDICSGSSYGNAGLIVPSYSIPLAAPGVIFQGLKRMFNPEGPFYIKPRFNGEFLSWLWKFRSACNENNVRKALPILKDLSSASLVLFDDLAALEGIDFGFEKKGVVEIFNTNKGFEKGVKVTYPLKKSFWPAVPGPGRWHASCESSFLWNLQKGTALHTKDRLDFLPYHLSWPR